MTTLAAPATPAPNDIALQATAWAKPVTAPAGVAGELGAQVRVDAGPVSLEDRVVAYGSARRDQVLVRGEKSAAITAGPVEVGGRVRTSVIGSLPAKVTVAARTSGNVGVDLDASVEGRTSLGTNGLHTGGKVAASVEAGFVGLGAKAGAKAGVGPKGLGASATIGATTNVGSAAIGASLTGVAELGRTGLKVGASSTIDARIGGRSISLAAGGSVRVDGSFPFLHVDGSIKLTTTREDSGEQPAPTPAA
jgi:hypothetical protein